MNHLGSGLFKDWKDQLALVEGPCVELVTIAHWMGLKETGSIHLKGGDNNP